MGDFSDINILSVLLQVGAIAGVILFVGVPLLTAYSTAKADQVRELQRLLDLFDLYTSQRHPRARVNECKQEAASILVSLATRAHSDRGAP